MKDEAIRKIFTDQTGRFPKKTSCGNQYIMVLINVDSDAILVEPMKNRTSGEMILAYQTLIDRLRTVGSIPKLLVWTMNALKISGTPSSSTGWHSNLSPHMTIGAT